MVALDFGIYAQQNLKLDHAVEQASVVAFNSRAAQPTVNTSQLSSYIAAVVGGSPTVSFQCNGSTTCGSAAPASKCIGAPTSAGGWPTFTDPSGSGSAATCASGAIPGYYLVIRAPPNLQVGGVARQISQQWRHAAAGRGAAVMIRALLRNQAGAGAVEFALIAPTFLMFLFLLLDGGRMMFAKQSLNELATATARCMATKQSNCATTSGTQTWAVNRGLARSNLKIASADVALNVNATCGGVSGMIQATISMPWQKGAMTLLPQSVAPASLSATACFPTIA